VQVASAAFGSTGAHVLSGSADFADQQSHGYSGLVTLRLQMSGAGGNQMYVGWKRVSFTLTASHWNFVFPRPIGIHWANCGSKGECSGDSHGFRKNGAYFAASAVSGIARNTHNTYGLLQGTGYIIWTLNCVDLTEISLEAQAMNHADSNSRTLSFKWSTDHAASSFNDIASPVTFGPSGDAPISGTAILSAPYTGPLYIKLGLSGGASSVYVGFKRVGIFPVATSWNFVPRSI